MTVPADLSETSIENQLAAAVSALTSRPDVKNVFMVACGGSYALMIPLQHIVQSTTAAYEAHALNSREFTTRAPLSLGENSVVILCSHSGNTPETVEAAAFARAKGALTISLTNELTSPLAQASEFVVGYQHGDDKNYSYTTAPLLYRLVYAGLDAVNGTKKASEVDAAVAKLHGIVTAELEKDFDRADAWGKAHARDELIYTLGSGPNYGVAYSFAVCLLQEMLWVHSAGINSAEYFHGPFEITDYDVPFLETIGLGVSRVIDRRAHDFVVGKSDDVLTIDAADWDLSAIPEDLRASYAHLVFGPVLRQYAITLADHKGHPLTVRRYMWRMEY